MPYMNGIQVFAATVTGSSFFESASEPTRFAAGSQIFMTVNPLGLLDPGRASHWAEWIVAGLSGEWSSHGGSSIEVAIRVEKREVRSGS
jgi:hypothetical protein